MGVLGRIEDDADVTSNPAELFALQRWLVAEGLIGSSIRFMPWAPARAWRWKCRREPKKRWFWPSAFISTAS